MDTTTSESLTSYDMWKDGNNGNSTTQYMVTVPYMRHYETYIYLSIGVIGVLGNSFAVIVLCSSKTLRRKLTNMFIINQSVIDCVASLLLMASADARLNINQGHSGILGQLYCRIWANRLLVWSMFMSSTYNLLAVTMERYMEIVYPLKHRIICTPERTHFVIFLVWLIGPAYNIPLTFPTSAAIDGACFNMVVWPNEKVRQFCGILTALVEFILPLLLMIYAYSKMAIGLRTKIHPDRSNEVSFTEQQRLVRMERARKGIIKTLALVTVSFVLCWSWNQMFFFLYNVGYNVRFDHWFYAFTIYAAFANSFINPFIYAFQFKQFQKQARKLLCKKNTAVVHVFPASEVSASYIA